MLTTKNMPDKSLYRIALTHIKGVGVMHARNLMEVVGDEESIFKEDEIGRAHV